VALSRLGLPLIVSRLAGLQCGHDARGAAADLDAAWRAARSRAGAFAEPWIDAGSDTVAILQGAALPSIRIETPRAFYDYEAKYFRQRHALLPVPRTAHGGGQKLRALSLPAFEACRRRAGPRRFMLTVPR